MTKDIFFCDNTKKPPAGGDKVEGVKGKKSEEAGGFAAGVKERKHCHVFVGRFFDVKREDHSLELDSIFGLLDMNRKNQCANKNTSP